MIETTTTRRMSAIASLQETCASLAADVIAEPLADIDDLDELVGMIQVLIRMRNR